MPNTDANELEWAEHLFEEWKYRHEAFWKTLYRSLSAIAVLTTIPFVKADFLKPIRDKNIPLIHGWMAAVYVSLPCIIFVAMCLLLISEFAKQKQLERRLADIRGRHNPDRPNEREAFDGSRTKIVSISFIVIGSALLGLWIYVVWDEGRGTAHNRNMYEVVERSEKEVPNFHAAGTHAEVHYILLNEGHRIYATCDVSDVSSMDSNASCGFRPLRTYECTLGDDRIQKALFPLSDLQCKDSDGRNVYLYVDKED